MDATAFYDWWFIWIPITIIPAISILAVIVATTTIISNYKNIDSEDKTAIAVMVVGFIVVNIGIYWKSQLYLDFNNNEEYFTKMDIYYKMALQPMLLQTIGPILIGLGAFIRTKTHILLKIIALIYIINIITVNFQWFIAGSHML